MIERFLRRPQTAGEVAADAVRALGIASVLVAALGFGATDAGIVAFVTPALLVPRFIGVRVGFDLAFCLTLLVAAWSNVLDLYTTVPWWDVPVHLLCTGLLAAMAYLVLERLGMVGGPGARHPRATAVIVTGVSGLALGAVWEMVEWFGRAVIDPTIFVGYDDTIGDLAVDAVGSLVAGVIVATVPLLSPRA
ncbi:hypothetical protein ACFJGV_13535 [Cnuibacter sp. UC19_7]|uniref:hypothetical protein n=1 Tax=Cnuibacter sp. UC19_7 TaxID=3350166 RepID=UPI0036724F38